MDEHEIVKRMEDIHLLCGRIAACMQPSVREGRMASIGEAQRMERMSMDLQRSMTALPRNLLAGIISTDCRVRVSVLLREAQTLLKTLVKNDDSETKQSVNPPKVASGRLTAYSIY